LPPRSSSKDTCSGWWTSPTQCPRYFRASSRSCSLALDDDSIAKSFAIAETTHSVASGQGSSSSRSASRGRLT
jgi:hypothetical protein